MLRSLPNLISVARILMAPATVWLLLTGEFAAAFVLFVVAGVSDAVDGALARLLNARTALGSYLDPLADKVLLVGVFAALGYREILPVWLVVLFVSRDLFIVGGAVFVNLFRPAPDLIEPTFVSKLNTAAQIVLAGIVLAATGFPALFGPWAEPFVAPLIWGSAATTLLSGAIYLVRAGRTLSAPTEDAWPSDLPHDAGDER